MRRAFITGITGQDGSYLAELLLEKAYEVHGLSRRSNLLDAGALSGIVAEPLQGSRHLILHHGDLTDGNAMTRLIQTIQPDEVYNLGAQSLVQESFGQPEHTVNVTALGTVRLLEAIRASGVRAKFYQASTSEIFGNTTESPQRETTLCVPVSPYGAAKLFAHWYTKHARRTYGIFACAGICFNHESPRRGLAFVTRKITWGLANILAGRQQKIVLGNLEAKRDWGYAKEYVEAMWLMLQQDQPDDYVVATGEAHSIRDFLHEAFSSQGLDWEKYVEVDPKFYRPAETHLSVGDAAKARQRLGWRPRMTFRELVHLMVDADLHLVAREHATSEAVTTATSGGTSQKRRGACS